MSNALRKAGSEVRTYVIKQLSQFLEENTVRVVTQGKPHEASRQIMIYLEKSLKIHPTGLTYSNMAIPTTQQNKTNWHLSPVNTRVPGESVAYIKVISALAEILVQQNTKITLGHWDDLATLLINKLAIDLRFEESPDTLKQQEPQ